MHNDGTLSMLFYSEAFFFSLKYNAHGVVEWNYGENTSRNNSKDIKNETHELDHEIWPDERINFIFQILLSSFEQRSKVQLHVQSVTDCVI